jgi:membrane-bound lytic murein transglycosylase
MNLRRTRYTELFFAGTLLMISLAIPGGESNLTSSRAYGEEQQIYLPKTVQKPLILTSTGVLEQQGTQQLMENQTEIQQQSPSQHAAIHTFEDTFIGLVNDTRSLSIAYQDEIAKLQSGVYDNQTFVTITDLYLQMYQQLLDRANALNQSTVALPTNYSKAIDLYFESIRTEMMSQEHFRNYLATGDLSENERSLELLTDSLRHEIEAFRAFRSVADDATVNGDGNSTNAVTDM